MAHRVVHDLRSAALAGGAARSTGHATLDAPPLAILRGTEALTTTQWLVPDGERASVVAPALRTSGVTVIEPT